MLNNLSMEQFLPIYSITLNHIIVRTILCVCTLCKDPLYVYVMIIEYIALSKGIRNNFWFAFL